MQRFILIAVTLLPLLAVGPAMAAPETMDTAPCTPASLPGLAAQTVSMSFAAGWNLIAGQGVPLTGNDGPLYTLQAGDTAYEVVPTGTPLCVGIGYWAYFDSATTIEEPAPVGLTIMAIPLPANQWVLVGRPAFTPGVPKGADVVYVFDAASQQYRRVETLDVGQGAWAFSRTGSEFSWPIPGVP